MTSGITHGSRAAFVLGALALATVVVGGLVALAVEGVTPTTTLISSVKSAAVGTALLTGVGLGCLAVGCGAVVARSTRSVDARRQAINGLVLGLQAAVIGLAVLLWRSGDITDLVENFLNFDLVTPEISAFFTGALNTIKLAAIAEVAGLILGLAVALLAISSYPTVRAPARLYINFFRGTPLLWQLSFLYFGVTLGLQLELSAYTAGITALSLNTAAYLAEVFRAGIQSIERSQLDAARGLGLSQFQAMRTVVVPQAVIRVIPALMNDFVLLIKDTSLVLFLGLTVDERELMSVGQEGYADSFNASFFVFTALGYLAICLPLIRLVNATEKRLRSGLVGVAG